MVKSKKKIIVRILKKWDKIEGRAFVIFDNQNRVITFGKYKGETKKTIIKKNKKQINKILNNRELSKKIKLTKTRKIKTETVYKKKFEVFDKKEKKIVKKKKISWRVKKIPYSNLKKDDLFQLIFSGKYKDGSKFFIRSRQYALINERMFNACFEEIRQKIATYRNYIKNGKLELFKWFPSKQQILTYG